MFPWLLSILLSALVILLVGRVSRSFEVDGLGTAFMMAAGLTIAGSFLAGALVPLQAAITTSLVGGTTPPETLTTAAFYSYWAISIGFDFVENVLLLLVLALILPGVTLRGIVGVLVAAVLLSAVGLLWRFPLLGGVTLAHLPGA